MGIALVAQEFEGQKGQKVALRGDGLGAWQAGGPDDVFEVEPGQEGGKEVDACGATLEGAAVELLDGDRL